MNRVKISALILGLSLASAHTVHAGWQSIMDNYGEKVLTIVTAVEPIVGKRVADVFLSVALAPYEHPRKLLAVFVVAGVGYLIYKKYASSKKSEAAELEDDSQQDVSPVVVE